MNAALNIRDAAPSDVPKVEAIINVSFPRFFRYFASHSVKEQDTPLLIAEQNGAVAGFAKLIDFQVDGERYGCILWIATHPSFRRKGVASSLTDAGVDCLKKLGAKAVFASTQRRNKAAQATLHKSGFKRVGFVGLWHLFKWQVFSFYRSIWYAPGEIVLIRV